MSSVSVFDFNEGDIGEFLIGPCEGNAPFGDSGIGIDGIPPGAVQFMVMKGVKVQKIFFCGMMEDEEALLRFIDADVNPTAWLLF